jgi:hypothetical protein
MSGGITNIIKFRTLENTSKYYWKEKRTDVDYPSSMLGTKTPTLFIWSKMEHMINVMDQAISKNNSKVIVDGSGKELTAMEFLARISNSRMWTFDFPLKED